MRVDKARRAALTLAILSLTALAPAALAATPVSPATRSAATVGPRLRYLRHRVETGRLEGVPDRVGVTLVVEKDGDALLERSLPAGVEVLRDAAGSRLATAHVLPVLARLRALDDVARMKGVVFAETSWFPFKPPPPLDVSRPEIETPLVWPEIDFDGLPVTGNGVVVADFDTGVDVFQPVFFVPDGGTFQWLDTDGDRVLSSGADAVDLNGNGSPDPDEVLRVFETPFTAAYPTANPPGYDLDVDWLYADSNADGDRDYGRSSGFSDATPSLGEPLFFADDGNGNNALDPEELLVGLGTSKIRAVRQKDGVVRRRGVDLIDTEIDSYGGHGTKVLGILAGAVPWTSRMAGQAPGAELIVATLSYDTLGKFEPFLADHALWARGEGARLFVYEIGDWVWRFLDGSDPDDVMVTDLAAEGYTQLTATGNLTGGGQQLTRDLPASARDSFSAVTQSGIGIRTVWVDFLWNGSTAELALEVELPDHTTFTPCLCDTTEAVSTYLVYSGQAVSPRGTAMDFFEFRGDAGQEIPGAWTFWVTPARDMEVTAYSGDDRASWYGFTAWVGANDVHTVTTPATADLSIAVGAYGARDASCGPHGDIARFSGRGPRIDGASVVDLTAPGCMVFSPAPKEGSLGLGAFVEFGGTSPALPHVAGGASLLAQLNPNDPHEVIEKLLRRAAVADAFTGPTPNDTWGMGKARFRAAYDEAAKPSLLRDDSVVSISPLAPDRVSLFPDSGRSSLRLAGANGFSHEGEGPAPGDPGSADGDAFLAAHIDSGFVDPEGPTIVSDASRPLVLYQLAGPQTLRLVKTTAGIEISY